MQKQEFISLCGQYNPGAFESITDMDYRKYEALYGDRLDDGELEYIRLNLK